MPPQKSKKAVTLYAWTKDPAVFELLEFYREDRVLLESLGYDMSFEHRLWRGSTTGADLLYAWWGATAIPCILARRLRGLPTILTGATDFRDHWGGRSKRWMKAVLILLAARLADHTLAISEYELNDFRRFRTPRTSLAYLSVDTAFYSPGPKSLVPTGVTVGQLNQGSIERKGIDLAIRATAIIRRSVPDYHLNVIGPVTVDGQRWLDAAAKRFDFNGVRILGQVTREEKRALLQSAWIYMQPSIYEAFGMAMVEAMACATAPIASAEGALPEIVSDAGLVLPARDPAELAIGATRLLTDHAWRDHLSRAARTRALAFTREKRAMNLQQVFDDVLGQATK